MTKNNTLTDTVSIALTGSGGAGVVTAGQMLVQAAANAGCYGLMVRSSGPQIRGGESAAYVRLGSDQVDNLGDAFDIMFAVDWLNVERFIAEIPLSENSLVICDAEAGDVPDVITATGAKIAALPLQKTAAETKGGRPNMVGLGILAALIGIADEAVEGTLEKVLGRKGSEAMASSRDCVHAGRELARDISQDGVTLQAQDNDAERWTITGNEMAGLGALRGGVRFVAAYPITPATEVLEWLAPNLAKVGGSLVQAEDELASINMAIGGSFGGIPSLTATSGPGLALMMESFGLALASETPVVIINVMRGGPSTGIPTKSEQSDLNIAVYGMHGDAPHITTAATSVSDCLFTTQWTVHLAEALQCPAIVLTDQSLGQTRAIVNKPADLAFIAKRETMAEGTENYRRYAVTASGVSPMSIPGMADGTYVADGLEHNPRGTPSSQAEDHSDQLDKRQRKLDTYDFGDHWAEIEGDGETAIVTWGSCTGPAREACEQAAADGLDVKLISLRLLAPAQTDRFQEAIKGVKRMLVVEQTHSQQFYKYLRAHYDLPDDVKVFNQPGPLPVRPGLVHEQLKSWS